MRKIAKTICVLCVIIFASYLFNPSAVASEVLSASFGNTTLKLPYPNKLCLLGRSAGENTFWDHQKMTQSQANNKLLAVWLDCDSKRKLRNGEGAGLKEWVIVVGHLTGTSKAERVFPEFDRDQYVKGMTKVLPDLAFDEIWEKVDRTIEEANEVYFGDKSAVTMDDPINLGILAVEDAVYMGMIMNIGTKLERNAVAGIFSSTLINGVPISHYTYKDYQGKKTVSELLSKSKYYNAKLIFSN
jgi:hypothetical protein